MKFAAFEVIAVAGDRDGALHAVRVRCAGKHRSVMAAASEEADKPFADALADVCGAVGIRRDRMLVLAPGISGGGIFQTETPILSGNELHSALEFEIPRQLLRPPADYRIAWRVLPRVENAEKQQLLVWVADAETLEPVWAALRSLKWKADAVLNPFLAIPSDWPPETPLMLPGVEPDFFWRSGVFHPVAENQPDDAALRAWVRREFEFTGETETLSGTKLQAYFPALLAAYGFLSGHVDGGVVPPALRPRRLRTQLRTMAFLAAALLLCWGISGVRRMADHYETYSGIVNRTRAAQKRAGDLQRKLRSREKGYKEMVRVLELAAANRDFLANLAVLSAALPDDMLVSNLRINDTAVEMTLQTSSENTDLGAALRKVPEFKVGTLQNRKINDTLTMIDLRLVRQPGGAK